MGESEESGLTTLKVRNILWKMVHKVFWLLTTSK